MSKKLQSYYLDKVSLVEIYSVFLVYFGQANYVTNKKIKFTSKNSGQFLVIEFNNKNKIINLEEELDTDSKRALSNKIKNELIDNQEDTIIQVLCFSEEPIEGSYRYKELFQISPISAQSPKINQSWCDHPFVLELRYTSCPEVMVNTIRIREKAETYLKFLNIVTKSRIFVGPIRANFFWGQVTLPDNSTATQWIQTGYVPEPVLGKLENFSEIKSEIPRISVDKYYSSGFIRSTDIFSLPENISEVLDIIFSMSAKEYTKIQIASTWLAQIGPIWQYSASASYIATVCAIEALVEKTEKTCPNCTQKIFSVNENFKKFIDTYFPDINNYPKERNLIYKTRSDLAHGKAIMLTDLSWIPFGNPQQDKQDALQRKLQNLTYHSILNWVLSHKS